jgi:hypothetical protein
LGIPNGARGVGPQAFIFNSDKSVAVYYQEKLLIGPSKFVQYTPTEFAIYILMSVYFILNLNYPASFGQFLIALHSIMKLNYPVFPSKRCHFFIDKMLKYELNVNVFVCVCCLICFMLYLHCNVIYYLIAKYDFLRL